MELLDPASPQAARDLLARAGAEQELGAVAEDREIIALLEQMLEGFQSHEICRDLSRAKQAFRELDFAMSLGPAVLGGQIDLIYQDGAGEWHIVDYKSDRIGAAGPAGHVKRYELQMLLYAAAAGRHFGQAPARASLYFLRPAAAEPIELSPAALAEAEDRAAALAGQLVAARRSRQFGRRDDKACEACPYGALCGTAKDLA